MDLTITIKNRIRGKKYQYVRISRFKCHFYKMKVILNMCLELEGQVKDINFLLDLLCLCKEKMKIIQKKYTQKSIVILTNMPLFIFYYNLLELIYSNIKQGNLKAQLQFACEEISNWEKPQPNKLFNLQIFNNKIAVEILHYLKMQMIDSQMNVELQEVLVDLTLTNMIQFDDLRDIGYSRKPIFLHHYSNLRIKTKSHAMLVHLPKLWELIVTNQQFMVIADSPYRCSEIILGMICLISHSGISDDISLFMIRNFNNQIKNLKFYCSEQLLEEQLIPFF